MCDRCGNKGNSETALPEKFWKPYLHNGCSRQVILQGDTMSLSEKINASFRISVPWGWSEVVCDCVDPAFGSNYSGRVDIECAKCNKILRHCFMLCTGCGEYYCRIYTHRATRTIRENGKRVSQGPLTDKRMCWNCVCKEYPAQDGDIPPVYTEAPRKARPLDEIAESFSFDF